VVSHSFWANDFMEMKNIISLEGYEKIDKRINKRPKKWQFKIYDRH
jgi:hypothetical protein